jgi:hypothetical protein
MNKGFHRNKMKLLTAFILLLLTICPSSAEESVSFLVPPGLRLIKDPSTFIPASNAYANQNLVLPDYRDPSGKPAGGWEVRTIETRRFSSHRSARLYFRISDLAKSTVFIGSTSSGEMRIWPGKAFIVLETYEGDASSEMGAEPIEITAMAKGEIGVIRRPPVFFPADWSYARFTPKGNPFLDPDKVQECHGCHSIAFHLTGDLIFTTFPRRTWPHDSDS